MFLIFVTYIACFMTCYFFRDFASISTILWLHPGSLTQQFQKVLAKNWMKATQITKSKMKTTQITKNNVCIYVYMYICRYVDMESKESDDDFETQLLTWNQSGCDFIFKIFSKIYMTLLLCDYIDNQSIKHYAFMPKQ